jgi:hypothetical protein
MSSTAAVGFKIIGTDNVVYGPVELSELVEWLKDQRVTAETWVYSERDDAWKRAPEWPELKLFFEIQAQAAEIEAAETEIGGLKPSLLRRVKVLAEFSDEELRVFMGLMEVQRVSEGADVVKQGDPGDAMYLLFEGELRVRMMINGRETVLSTLRPGDSFGEVSLFDHGPRTADVLANQDSVLLRISSASFQRLLQDAPNLAAPFLLGMGKTLTSRTRPDNKHLRDSISFARTGT